MARARNIKPAFFMNDELAALGPVSAILFAGLWCIADRSGRLADRPLRIKAETVPYYECDVDDLLAGLETAGFIQRYEAENTKYIQILNFEKHQNPHKNEKASTIPAPELHRASTVQAPEKHSTNRADSLNLIPDSKEKTRADTRAFQILKSKFGDKKGGSLAAALLKTHTGPQVLEILKRSEGKSDEYAWLRACCKLRLPDDPILLWQVQKAVGLSEEYHDIETQQAGIMAHIAADKALTAKAQAVIR